MSYADNIENALKNLEAHEERDPAEEKRRRARDEEARLAAPHAEALKNSAFARDLMDHAVRQAHSRRTKVHIAWLHTALRLEARDLRLELRPGAKGISAVFFKNGVETASEPLDLKSKADKLAERWLKDLG